MLIIYVFFYLLIYNVHVLKFIYLFYFIILLFFISIHELKHVYDVRKVYTLVLHSDFVSTFDFLLLILGSEITNVTCINEARHVTIPNTSLQNLL